MDAELYQKICNEAEKITARQQRAEEYLWSDDEYQATYEINLVEVAYEKGRQDEWQYQMDHAYD